MVTKKHKGIDVDSAVAEAADGAETRKKPAKAAVPKAAAAKAAVAKTEAVVVDTDRAVETAADDVHAQLAFEAAPAATNTKKTATKQIPTKQVPTKKKAVTKSKASTGDAAQGEVLCDAPDGGSFEAPVSGDSAADADVPAKDADVPAKAAPVRVRAPEPPAVAPDFPATEYPIVDKLLTGFVAGEVHKVGLSHAVLGLSGGIDSAVSAAVAVRALGAENVLGVFMPYSSSSPESEADARAVAIALGIELLVVDITPQVDAYFSGFPDASRLRRGNKMARERMTILYDHSAARSALVIGTSNKTELLLGYGTLYGDMASALNPIGDLYKTQVWGFAAHLGLPASVIGKAPTADLWSGQTDENELGFSYHEVDRLLYRMIDERCGVEELVALGFDAAFVERISRMVRSSQFKRRLPIIAKLSARSIDTDFRYSRDWGL